MNDVLCVSTKRQDLCEQPYVGNGPLWNHKFLCEHEWTCKSLCEHEF